MTVKTLLQIFAVQNTVKSLLSNKWIGYPLCMLLAIITNTTVLFLFRKQIMYILGE
jgi:hypothetical protein